APDGRARGDPPDPGSLSHHPGGHPFRVRGSGPEARSAGARRLLVPDQGMPSEHSRRDAAVGVELQTDVATDVVASAGSCERFAVPFVLALFRPVVPWSGCPARPPQPAPRRSESFEPPDISIEASRKSFGTICLPEWG